MAKTEKQPKAAAKAPKTAAKAPKVDKKDNNIDQLDNYAILALGSKQQLVRPGQRFTVELLKQAVGESVEIDQVVLVKNGDKISIGKPLVAGASVRASVVEEVRGEKLRPFHKLRRKHHRKTTGHRQTYTVLQIEEIRG